MKKARFILNGLICIVFIVYLTFNVSITRSFRGKIQLLEYNLQDIVAKAENGVEDDCNSSIYCTNGKATMWTQGVCYCCHIMTFETGRRQN